MQLTLFKCSSGNKGSEFDKHAIDETVRMCTRFQCGYFICQLRLLMFLCPPPKKKKNCFSLFSVRVFEDNFKSDTYSQRLKTTRVAEWQ